MDELGEDSVTVFLGVEIPGVEGGVEGFQADALVGPFAGFALALLAAIALHGVAVVAALVERFDQDQTALARSS